jgi:hypothetical protein
MKTLEKRAVEMTGYGKRGKPKAGFPTFPAALGNRPKRDFHIPTAAVTTARKSGKPKAGFPLSHRGFQLPTETQKGETPNAGSRRSGSSFD